MKLWIGILFLILAAGIVNAEITGEETIIRTIPDTANLGSTFSITYTVQQASGLWGATIVDSVSGGCKFLSGKTRMNEVMISDAGNTRTIIISAPGSAGSCTFTGDYQFGNFPIKNFAAQTITISGKVSQKCGNDIKEGTEQCDGNDLGGADCISLRFFSGTLSCTSSCKYDATNCIGREAICENNICEAGETCGNCAADCGSCKKITGVQIIIASVVILIAIILIILILSLMRKSK